MLQLLTFYLQWHVWYAALHQYALLRAAYEQYSMKQASRMLLDAMVVNMPHCEEQIVDWRT